MKRLLIILIALALVLSACTGPTRQDDVLFTLGHYESRQYYTSGDFQDFTDFALYTYEGIDMEDNPYFAPLTEGDLETLSAFLDNYESWIDTIKRDDPQDEVVVNYAFDRSMMDAGDWFYIYENPTYAKFGSYDIWFLDSQTCVLYYFHNNI